MKLMDGTKESTPKMGEDPMLHDLLWGVPDPDAGVTEEGRRILLSRVQESRAMRAGAKTRSLKPAGIVAGLVAFGTLTFGAAASGSGVQALLESVGLPSQSAATEAVPDSVTPAQAGAGSHTPGSNETAPPVTVGANERDVPAAADGAGQPACSAAPARAFGAPQAAAQACNGTEVGDANSFGESIAVTAGPPSAPGQGTPPVGAPPESPGPPTGAPGNPVGAPPSPLPGQGNPPVPAPPENPGPPANTPPVDRGQGQGTQPPLPDQANPPIDPGTPPANPGVGAPPLPPGPPEVPPSPPPVPTPPVTPPGGRP